MLENMIPAGQPTTDEESRELGERYRAVSKRCEEVLMNDME